MNAGARVDTALLAVEGVNAASLTNLTDDLRTVGAEGVWFARQPAMLRLPFRVRIVAPTLAPVRMSNGHDVWPQALLDGATDWRLIIVPEWPRDALSDTARHDLCTWLRDCHRSGAVVAAVSRGVRLLVAARLLQPSDLPPDWDSDRPWYANEAADNRHALLVFGDRERIVTTAGTRASHNDLVAYLVQRLTDRATMQGFLRHRGPHWMGHAQEADAGVTETHALSDPMVRAALRWLDRNLAHPSPAVAMARHAGVTARTLQRRFQQALGETPKAYVQSQRVARAQGLLMYTDKTVKRVAEAVGYRDLPTFRRVFRAQTGQSPSEFRRAYRAASRD